MTRSKNNEPRSVTVVGLFGNQPDAERAIRDLKASAFADHQIGVLMQDPEAGRQLAEDTGTKTGDGAKAGALGGGLLGGLVGLLGAIAIPGIGPIVAGGALASTLAGAGIGAAAGGLLGALVGMGIPEEEARYYESGLKEGGILITVDAEARREEAEAILSNAGAEFGGGRYAGSTAFGRDRDRTIEGGESRRQPREEVTANKRRITDRERARGRSRDEGELESEPWRGNERRYRHDPAYPGPERRMARL
jgi:heat induced stress protein YflT